MHCDFLNVTVPESYSQVVRGELVDALGSLGASSITPDLHRLGGGTFKFTEGRGFTTFGMSGQAMDYLRVQDDLSRHLYIFGSVPHRVTRIDVAHDIPQPAPPVLKSILRKARSGSLSLTRKTLRPQSIRFIDNHNHYDPGVRTGTVYLGSRSAKVYARVYDKRNERLDRGFSDPGNMLRYELTVTGKLSPSLRDVVEPVPMFWKFMSEVLPPPANVSDWAGEGDGYAMEPPLTLLPAEILRRKIDTSPDISQMLELAERIGPHGYQLMLRMLEHKFNSHTIQPADVDTAS